MMGERQKVDKEEDEFIILEICLESFALSLKSEVP